MRQKAASAEIGRMWQPFGIIKAQKVTLRVNQVIFDGFGAHNFTAEIIAWFIDNLSLCALACASSVFHALSYTGFCSTIVCLIELNLSLTQSLSTLSGAFP